MAKKSLIIIGGGAAGLMTALELGDLYDITLLESNDRLGGRMWTSTVSGNSNPVEAGAEFVHGNLPITLGLLSEAGIPYNKVDGKMYRLQNGRLAEQEEMTEGWEQLLEKMQQLKSDLSLHQFLQEYFGGNEHAELRRQAANYAGGFDLADPATVSTQSLYKEWSREEENFRIVGGYARLVEYLQGECIRKGCRVLTGKIVKQVDWEKNDVTVYTVEGEKFYAQQLVITVPPAVLTKNGATCSINFTPPMRQQEEALTELGMGKVIKVVLSFKQIFWKNDAGFFFSDESFPTWWTQLPAADAVLTGWAGGRTAELLEHHSDGELLEIAIQSLSNIFRIPVRELSNNIAGSLIINWQAKESALHGYSYSTLASANVKKLLKEPVMNTIWFAGEAMYEGPEPGTVEAAFANAKDLAARIRKI